VSIKFFLLGFGASSPHQFQVPYTYTSIDTLLPFFIMGKEWIRTSEQEAYLEKEFNGYLKARTDGEVKNWRIKLHEKWEERWPERQVLIKEWKLADDAQLNTAQMAALGEALAARKAVKFIYTPY
jgi:hypothetical protein